MADIKTFTIQFRMTKRCNAECTYCINPFDLKERMTFDEFKKSVDFIISDYLPNRDALEGDYVDLEYVGGEVSLLPTDEFEQCIDYAREAFHNAGYIYSDGAQSNFTGSPAKLERLWNKFDRNMTTSIDHYTDARRLKGSSELYQKKFRKNIGQICTKVPAGSVYVLDAAGTENGLKEAQKALREGYAIGLYPAYEANNPVAMAPLSNMAEMLKQVMDEWVLNYDTAIEPLGHILRMVLNKDQEICGTGDACPFAFGCAAKSLSVEPNGDLYVCMDMAETKNHKLGNAVDGVCDNDLIRRLAKRGIKLNGKCKTCKYRYMCKGGCMNHAMLTGNEYDPSYFCEVWYALFEHTENLIEKLGAENVRKWISAQDKVKFYC